MQRRYLRKPGDRILRLPRTRPWRILLPSIRRPRTSGSSSLVLIYGFLGAILLGSILLMLPISSKSGQVTPFVNSLFTATSAVCVTGLVLVDTADYWSFFGQIVILILIQLGGFGFMTSATLFLLMFGRRVGLRERLLIRESMGLARLGGLIRIVVQMALFTLFIEIAGAVLFYIHFSMNDSTGMAVWHSCFQSISAFNNAGFDLYGGFQSMLGLQRDPLMILVTAVLIFLGGISYLVISDIFRARGFSRLTLDSKLVLSTTLSLLVLGTLVIFLTECNHADTLGGLPVPLKILNAFFHSVTARTAGFSTVSMTKMADYALFFTMLLMFVGGASGSTAGGVKVNTAAVLMATIWSTIRGKENAQVFGREFTLQQVHRALTVALLSTGLVAIVVFLLTLTEEFRFIDLLIETVSAFGTVGLSTGITPALSVAGRLIITLTMFVGRLGPLTLALTLIQRQQPTEFRYPIDIIRIG